MLATAVLGLGATGCGEDPIVEVENIPVGTTYVVLDSGFVEALASLELTPGTVGAAALENGSALPDHRRKRHLLRAGHRGRLRAG